jgi:hypothetical protein
VQHANVIFLGVVESRRIQEINPLTIGTNVYIPVNILRTYECVSPALRYPPKAAKISFLQKDLELSEAGHDIVRTGGQRMSDFHSFPSKVGDKCTLSDSRKP